MIASMERAKVIRSGEQVSPFHYYLNEPQWHQMVTADPLWFIGHWCDNDRAYALFLDKEKPLLASTALIQRRYFSLSKVIPAASWPERISQDLWGTLPLDGLNTDCALENEKWTHCNPLSRRALSLPQAEPEVQSSEILHTDRLPLFSERRRIVLGATHVGIVHRLIAQTPQKGLHVLSRANASAFVNTPLAYTRAVEQALGVKLSYQGRDARNVLSEIERITTHLRDISTLAEIAQFPLLATHAAQAEELCVELCTRFGGQRRLTDSITANGACSSLQIPALGQALHAAITPRMPLMNDLHECMLERLNARAILTPARTERFSIGGLVGRASGRSFDLRQLEEDRRHVPGRAGSRLSGDSFARQSLRLAEINDSLKRIHRICQHFAVPLPESDSHEKGSGEGIGTAEGPHGDIWCWVRIKNGLLDGFYLRDPSLSLVSIIPPLLHDSYEDRLTLASFAFDPNGAEL